MTSRRLHQVAGHVVASGAAQPALRVGAHRGAMSHAPENTLAAFEKAIAFGVYRIECDVRKTADVTTQTNPDYLNDFPRFFFLRDCLDWQGVLVLMHDATIDRTTDGKGTLRELTLAELGAVNAVTGAGGGVGSAPVPTLAAALRCAKGKCKLLVELKDEDIASETVALIAAEGMTADCTISTFHEPSLRECT